MSILSDLKRLLFGAKAVASSSVDKASETVRETVRETREDLDQWMEKVRKESGVEPPEGANVTPPPTSEPEHPDFLERTGKQVRETGSELLHKAGDIAEKTGSVILEPGKKVEEGVEAIGEKVISAGEMLAEKAGNLAEKVGHEVIEKGSDILDRAKEFLKETSDKAGEEFGKVFDKAQEEAAKHDLEKAAREAEDLARKAKFQTDSPVGKDHLEALEGSTLAGAGDFFEKADQFAKGNYHHGELVIESVEKTEKPKNTAPTAGFEDKDGDGDDIIDDAEIVEPEKPA
jgi:ElaB/YqjD/DUF883 family membrane-anchored ribosome-binding protein